MRLLLAEDDAMIGEAVRAGLRRDGFTVDWVRDGTAASPDLRAAIPDLRGRVRPAAERRS